MSDSDVRHDDSDRSPTELLLDEEVPHVKDFYGDGGDEVHCENSIMSTWRYCPYCGDNIEDAPSLHGDAPDVLSTEEDLPDPDDYYDDLGEFIKACENATCDGARTPEEAGNDV